jgi:hypothetical protein
MNIKTAIAMSLALGVSAHAAANIRVCVNPGLNTFPLAVVRAEAIASRMFATAGVVIEWHTVEPAACRNPGETRTVILDFDTGATPDVHPGALAYARPYEAIHIVVLYDRIATHSEGPGQVSALLAHVMTHEITHLLEGFARHSQTGVMKANWDRHDMRQMAFKSLPFDPEDIDLIQRGLSQRAARVTPGATAAVPATTPME